MVQQIKYKSGGIILDKNKGVLFCVGEERDPQTNKKLLLTPGGTIKNASVVDLNNSEIIEVNKPLESEIVSKLNDELYEELALTTDMYTSKYIFTAESFAASNPNIKLVIYCYLIDLNSKSKIRPNYDPNNPEYDVFEAVWINSQNIESKIVNNKITYNLKDNSEIVMINARGLERKLSEEESKDYLLTAIWIEDIFSKLITKGLFTL